MSSGSIFFNKLPTELRLRVYEFVLEPATRQAYKAALPLLLINRQIYAESRKLFHDHYVFVKIKTPFEQTLEHVQQRQQVPIVLDHQQAPKFHGCSVTVKLEAAGFIGPDESDYFQFVIFLDDLPQFTAQWMFADLTWDFNCRLQIILELDAPFTPPYEAKQLSKAVQKQLLLPFGDVRRLEGTRVTGSVQPYSSVVKEMRALQATPYKSPEQCFRDAQTAKHAAIVARHEKRYHDSLDHLFKAWAEIFIVIDGDNRHEHADAWFDVTMSEDPYKGKNAKVERLSIRIELVAQTCLTYLSMKDYERCNFWGMRSINILREQLGVLGQPLRPQDEAITTGFPGAKDFGYVYLYTAEARQAVGDNHGAKGLFLVAREYLSDERTKIDEHLQQIERGHGR